MLYKANSVEHRNVKFTSSQPSRAHYHMNPTIIYFYQHEQKPNSIWKSFARQTFWNVSFIKFRQTFPPSKFCAIRYMVYHTVKTLEVKNFGKFGKLKQFAKFSSIFTIYITFSMQMDFNLPKLFLPNFLQSLFTKLFYHQRFHYIYLWY